MRDGQHERSREQGDGRVGSGSSRLQQLILGFEHALKARAQILHERMPAPLQHDGARHFVAALPAQLDGPAGDGQALGNQGSRLCDRHDLLGVVRGQLRQGIEFGVDQRLDADERPEEALVPRQHVAALPDFGILQVRPDLGDLALHLQRMPHQVRLRDVPGAEPQRQGQDQCQRNGGRLGNALLRCQRSNDADLALDSSHYQFGHYVIHLFGRSGTLRRACKPWEAARHRHGKLELTMAPRPKHR